MIRIAPGSDTHINPFDMDINNDGKDTDDPVTVKSNYICSICESAIGGHYGLNLCRYRLSTAASVSFTSRIWNIWMSSRGRETILPVIRINALRSAISTTCWRSSRSRRQSTSVWPLRNTASVPTIPLRLRPT